MPHIASIFRVYNGFLLRMYLQGFIYRRCTYIGNNSFSIYVPCISISYGRITKSCREIEPLNLKKYKSIRGASEGEL